MTTRQCIHNKYKMIIYYYCYYYYLLFFFYIFGILWIVCQALVMWMDWYKYVCMVKLVFNPGNYKYIIKHEKKIRMWTTLQRYQRSVPSFKNQLKKIHAIIYSDFFFKLKFLFKIRHFHSDYNFNIKVMWWTSIFWIIYIKFT